jgi:hypothetical protein
LRREGVSTVKKVRRRSWKFGSFGDTKFQKRKTGRVPEASFAALSDQALGKKAMARTPTGGCVPARGGDERVDRGSQPYLLRAAVAFVLELPAEMEKS